EGSTMLQRRAGGLHGFSGARSALCLKDAAAPWAHRSARRNPRREDAAPLRGKGVAARALGGLGALLRGIGGDVEARKRAAALWGWGGGRGRGKGGAAAGGSRRTHAPGPARGPAPSPTPAGDQEQEAARYARGPRSSPNDRSRRNTISAFTDRRS